VLGDFVIVVTGAEETGKLVVGLSETGVDVGFRDDIEG